MILRGDLITTKKQRWFIKRGTTGKVVDIIRRNGQTEYIIKFTGANRNILIIMAPNEIQLSEGAKCREQ